MSSWRFSDKLFFVSCFIPLFETVYLLFARYSLYTYLNGIPLSDSKLWFGCIKALANFGSWPIESVDWCLRRPFYPLIASQIYKFMPNLDAYFLFCSMIFSLILLYAVFQVRRVCGDFAGWVLVIGASALWLVYGATQTLSEQVGISLGTLALGYFMRYLLTSKSLNLYLGSAFSLIAQSTRPGNVFIYLIPLLFVILFEHQKVRVLARLLVYSYLPLFVLVVSVRKFLDIPNFMHSGNTWATVYGLQFGNQSWSSSYSILPSDVNGEIAIWSYIKNRTIQDILEHPLNIPKSILDNIQNIVDFGPLNLPTFFFLLTFFLYCIVYVYRNLIIPSSHLILVGFVLLAELVTYGISYYSDPIRTMSSSLMFSATLIVLPISALLRYKWLSSRTCFQRSLRMASQNLSYRYWATLTLFLFVMFLSPFKSESSVNIFTSFVKNEKCDFQIVLNDLPSRYVQQQDLRNIRGMNGEWWIEAIERLGAGSFLLVTSIDEEGTSHDSSIYLRKNSLRDLRKGDLVCGYDTKDEILNEIGFQEGFLLR